MSKYSITIGDFLLSHMTDSRGFPNGYGVINDNPWGEFYHYNEVIDKTYQYVFQDMNISIELPEQFQKDFCKRFYNREIGFEVWSQFQMHLETALNSTCYNLLKFYDELRNMEIKEALKTMDITTDTEAKLNTKGLSLGETTPEKDLSILYPTGEGVIKHADQLAENYGNNDSEGHNHTYGFSGRTPFEMANFFAGLTDVEEQIFNILDDMLFMQVY